MVLDDDGQIRLSDLPESLRPWGLLPNGAREDELPPYEAARDEALNAFRLGYVQRLLDKSGGNVSQAARAAGVSRRTLHRWIAQLRGSPSEKAE